MVFFKNQLQFHFLGSFISTRARFFVFKFCFPKHSFSTSTELKPALFNIEVSSVLEFLSQSSPRDLSFSVSVKLGTLVREFPPHLMGRVGRKACKRHGRERRKLLSIFSLLPNIYGSLRGGGSTNKTRFSSLACKEWREILEWFRIR